MFIWHQPCLRSNDANTFDRERTTIMSGPRALLMILGGSFIVLLSFVAATYVLDWSSPVSDQPYAKSSRPTAPLPVAQQSQGENLLWPSEDFANPNWKRNQVAIEPAAVKAPNGETAASRLVES